MQILAMAAGFCLVAVLVYVARYSSKIRVQATRWIAAPPEQVMGQLADLARWQDWNPWLEHDRSVRATHSVPADRPGAWLTWNSERTGAARITLLTLDASARQLTQQWTFSAPFVWRGRARWQLEAAPEGTQLRVEVRGRVSFLLRAFSRTVQEAQALTLRHGLDRLADQLGASPAASAPAIHYHALQRMPALRVACLRHHGSLDDLAHAVPQLQSRVRELLARAGLDSQGDGCAFYLRTQVRQRSAEVLVGIALPGDGPHTQPLPSPLVVHEVPAHTALPCTVRGPRSAHEVAWFRLMERVRLDGCSADLRQPPYELTAAAASAEGESGTRLHVVVLPAPGDQGVPPPASA